MIPRYRPYLSISDLVRYFIAPRVSMEQVENLFAHKAGASFALALPYGRSACYLLLKAYDIEHHEVILPAYTCQCMLGPLAETNNKPVFVDTAPGSFNMDHLKIKASLTGKTKMIITSAIWGFPIEFNSLLEFKKKGLLIIGDYALGLFSFLDKQKDSLNVLDAAFFSFGIGKELSFLGGGILLTNNEEIYNRLKIFREKECKKPGFRHRIKAVLKLIITSIVFQKRLYRYLVFFSEKTKLLDKIKQVDVGAKSNLPEDFFILPTGLQLYLAKDRITRIDDFINEKRNTLKLYFNKFKDTGNLKLFRSELVSHLPLCCKEKKELQKGLRRNNIHSNTIFRKTLPEILKQNTSTFPNATMYTRHLTMLPVYYGMKEQDINEVVKHCTEPAPRLVLNSKDE